MQHFARTVGDGVAFCRSVYGTTPMGDVVDMEGGLSEGLPDIVAFPDLETFRPVPWEPGVASVIADLFNPDGSRSEESPRAVLRRVVDKFAELGMRPFVGPELEFYLLDQDDDRAERLAPVRRRTPATSTSPACAATRKTPCSTRCGCSASTAWTSWPPTTSSPAASSRSTCGTPMR